MLVIILLGITLKYSILCTFSWFLVKLLLLIKTAQLTVRGSLNRPPPRFSLQEPPRARFILESHDVPVDEGFPGLLPYLCLLEIDQALTVAIFIRDIFSHSRDLFRGADSRRDRTSCSSSNASSFKSREKRQHRAAKSSQWS